MIQYIWAMVLKFHCWCGVVCCELEQVLAFEYREYNIFQNYLHIFVISPDPKLALQLCLIVRCCVKGYTKCYYLAIEGTHDSPS